MAMDKQYSSKQMTETQRTLEAIRQGRRPSDWLYWLSKEMAVQSELMMLESQANAFQALIGAQKE